MANHLARFDNFRDIAGFDPFHGLDELVRDFGLRPALRDFKIEPRIKLEVTEKDNAYTVKADIPGAKKEDIKVDVAGNEVSIVAEVKRETEQQDGQTLRCERYYGQQSRSFTLAHEIDADKVVASYAEGVLTLALPKKANGQSKQIAVS